MAEKPEDFNLPTSVVSRIVKESLPEGVNVSKDARAALSKAASVFVLYATSCANSNAMQNNRKTLTGQDVLTALQDMEFDSFLEPLQESLNAFREEKLKKASVKGKKNKDNANSSKEQPGEESFETEVVVDD